MLPEWYFEYKLFIDESISNYLDNYFNNSNYDNNLDLLKESVYYSIKWWKRIRAILALEFFLTNSWKDFTQIKENDDIIKYCISLEFIQAYSLIHDDLPCMDNDEYRRWELSVRKKYWEDTWTLVWDLLNSLAFEVLWELKNKNIWLDLVNELWKSIWFYWMIWGQILDIYYEWKNNEITLDSIIETHNKKTWALIKASIIWWLMLSWNNFNYDIYNNFWYMLWLAFQVKDDLFEKTKWKEYIEEKGFVFFMWETKTINYLDNLRLESLKTIKNLNSKKLNELVLFICNTKK